MNSPDVHPFARIDEEIDRYQAVITIDVGNWVDVGERITDVGQNPRDIFHALLDFPARENFCRLDDDQAAQRTLIDDQVTGNLHLVHAVDFTFDHVGGDVDVFLFRANRHLAGFHAEVHVTAVEVIRAQLFNVTGQFFPRILAFL